MIARKQNIVPRVFLTAILFLSCSMTGICANIKTTVNGIVFQIPDANVLECTASGYTADLPADLVIPKQIDYEGKTYAVTQIKKSAFHKCSNLTSVVIPSCVKAVGGYAFYGCSNLRFVTISSKETNIGYCTFAGCPNINSVTLPVRDYIGHFNDSKNISEVKVVSEKDLQDSVEDSQANTESSQASIEKPDNKVSEGTVFDKSFVIGDITYQINSEAPTTCTVVKVNPTSENIIIPQSVSSNGKEYTVTKIGNKAIYQIYNIKDIKLPGTITEIADSAFRNSIISRINIPQSVKSIGKDAFASVDGKIHIRFMYLGVGTDCIAGDGDYWATCIFAPSNKIAYFKKNFNHSRNYYTANSTDNFWDITEKRELTKAVLIGTWTSVHKINGKTTTNTLTLNTNGNFSFRMKVHDELTDYMPKGFFAKEVNGSTSFSGSWYIEDGDVRVVVNPYSVRQNYTYIPIEAARLREKYDPSVKAEYQREVKQYYYQDTDINCMMEHVSYACKSIIIDADYVWLRSNETTSAKPATKRTTATKRMTTAKKVVTRKK